MNTKTLGLIAVLVVMAGVWFLRGSGKAKTPPVTVNVVAKCSGADCGHEFPVKVKENFDRFVEFPRDCAKCNQKVAYQLVICGSCTSHWANNESRERMTKCPKCGEILPAE